MHLVFQHAREQEAPELALQQNWKMLILQGYPHANSKGLGAQGFGFYKLPGNPNALREF